VVNFFTAYLVNRSSQPLTVSITVAAAPVAVQWRGPESPLQLAGGERRRIDFGLEAEAVQLSATPQVELVLRDASGASLAATRLTLTGPLDKPAAKRAQ
jgi:hypothetical protein